MSMCRGFGIVSAVLAVLAVAVAAAADDAGHRNRLSVGYDAVMVNDRTWHDFYVLHGLSVGYGRSFMVSKVYPMAVETGAEVSCNMGDDWKMVNVTVPANVLYCGSSGGYEIIPYTGFYARVRVADSRYGGRHVQPGWHVGIRGGRGRWHAGMAFGVDFLDIAGMARYSLMLGASYVF